MPEEKENLKEELQKFEKTILDIIKSQRKEIDNLKNELSSPIKIENIFDKKITDKKCYLNSQIVFHSSADRTKYEAVIQEINKAISPLMDKYNIIRVEANFFKDYD